MNDTDIHLVQESFTKVEPIADTAAELFYDRLFDRDGDLKPFSIRIWRSRAGSS